MASNKDILEAQRYNRRRLITSFVAGSPEGKEVEPQAPTRPFVIGAALAVVMLLVSVGLRFLYPGADTKQSAGLAVVSSSGARYYLQDGQWHPISNRTSARLLGDSSTGTMKISDTDLAKYSQGQALGIADAPEDVPSDKNHMTADWTSCAIAERTFTWRERNRRDGYQASAASKALMSSSGVPHEVQKRAKRRPSGRVSQIPYCTLRERRSCPA